MQMRMMRNMELQKNKVLLGLSGGVDSATAALLLKEKGFDVTGFYFDVKGQNEQGRAEAEAVAKQLDIPLIYEDVSSDFRGIVIENFITEYLHGRTPNPCVLCNPNIKFQRLIHHADEIGAYYIATGITAGSCMMKQIMPIISAARPTTKKTSPICCIVWVRRYSAA